MLKRNDPPPPPPPPHAERILKKTKQRINMYVAVCVGSQLVSSNKNTAHKNKAACSTPPAVLVT